MVKRILILLLIFIAPDICAQKSPAKGVTAVSAVDFLNSIGVVSSVSVRGETLDKTIECTRYTGIRWFRAGYESGIPTQDLITLYRQTGAKICYGLLSGGADIPRLLAGAEELARANALLSIEGPNEPNNWGITYQGETGGRDKSWLPVAKLQRDLYQTVKTNPVLNSYPVWSLCENGAQTDNTGLQFLTIPEDAQTLMPAGTTFGDYANCHNYFCHPSWPGLHDNQTWVSADPTSRCPVDGLYGNYGSTWLKHFPGYSEEDLLLLPRVTTETGYAMDDEVTEEIQGKLYINAYLSQFKRGWSYTAMYLLRTRSDETNHEAYAFYTLDYTPKKAAVYLHNLTTILNDQHQATNLRKLDYSIHNQPETVHDLLLQKSDGRLELVLWGERFTGGTDEITVDLGATFPVVKIFDPTAGTEAVRVLKNTGSVKLVMSNHPMIIEINL